MKFFILCLLAIFGVLTGCRKQENASAVRSALVEQIKEAHDAEAADSSQLTDRIVAVDQKYEALELQKRVLARLEEYGRRFDKATTDEEVIKIDLDEIAASKSSKREMDAMLERWEKRKH